MTNIPDTLAALSKCPFCGDCNAYTCEGEWGQGYPLYWVQCDCGAEMGGRTKAEAIAAWNTRAGEPS